MENGFNSMENTQNVKQDTQEGSKPHTDGEEGRQEEIPAGRKLRNSIIELCVYVAIIVVCVAFVPKYVLQRTIVDGKSMMDTLKW